MHDFGLEKAFQDEIFTNYDIQKDICKSLDIDFSNVKFVREDKYINGIIADFTIFENNSVRAIMECKGGEINVTDYVRGIGQIFQYEYFAKNKLTNKNYNFCEFEKFYSIYIFPDRVLRLNEFNIGLFKYPDTKKIIEINSKNLAVRLVGENELKKLGNSKQENLKIISQYYVRDNRIFELYFLLKVLLIYKIKAKKVDRQDLELQILRKTNTINNQNWRNAFISLASLGFIDSKNYPNEMGAKFANLDFANFAYMMFDSYLSPYYEVLFDVLKKEPNLSNQKIAEKIRENQNIKTDILFLTQSDGRYISSWLSIARDDFAILDFAPRSNERKILFDPFISNKDAFIKQILQKSKFNDYKNVFEKVINEL